MVNQDILHSSLERILFFLSNPLGHHPSKPSSSELLPSLAHLNHLFHLSPFEQDVLLLCLGFEIFPDVAALCAKLQASRPHSFPCISLALAVFPNSNWSVFSPRSPLQFWQLIVFSPSYPVAWTPISLDKRILCFLLGESTFDEHLHAFISPLSTTTSQLTLSPSHAQFVDHFVSSWLSNLHLPPLLQLSGGEITTKYKIAHEACLRLGYSCLKLSVAALPSLPHEVFLLKKRWEREALLSHSILFLDCDDLSTKEFSSSLSLSLFLENIITPVIISTRDRIQSNLFPLLSFDVPPLGYTEQKTIWLTQLGSFDNNPNGQIDRLASEFNLSASAIETACLQYKNQSQQAEDTPNPDLLWDYCRNQARPHLDDLAQRLDSTATWSDLVLPKPQRQILEDIATHLKHRAKVYQDWGFSGKGSRGLGLCALFHGESGTGKTMAAEVLANHFRLDLYRIDLSAAVSKYVGETEKNLRRIFDAAESGGAILLFDEADAIFGKRTEVNDSRDRYANVEISYLLQRIEAFSGLAILTSNRKEDLDTAFARRIRFAVTFTFPDASCRSQIWQCIFPSQTPTQGLDYQKLGQLKIAGGNIRNIALNAAFLAAEAEEPVMMKHILAGAHREYLKLKRLLSDEEIRGWVF